MTKNRMHTFAKPVVFSTRLIPNFLWHMLAVGKIGYDSDYADTYHDTVSDSTLELLCRHRDLLTFGEGEGGALSAFFAMFPAFLPLVNHDDLAKYFVSLERVLSTRSLTAFTESFPDANWSDHFLSRDLNTYTFTDDSPLLAVIAHDLGDAYLNCLDVYKDSVWPDARSALSVRARELTGHFSGRDYILEWEEMLGLTFAAPRYDISLCFANKNGPDYNSLGYGGNLMYYDKPLDQTCQFISHEIGTHLMIDTYFRLSSEPNIDFRKLYAAYETLAMFFNRRLLGVDELAYRIPQFDDKAHIEKYERIYRSGINPEEMIISTL